MLRVQAHIIIEVVAKVQFMQHVQSKCSHRDRNRLEPEDGCIWWPSKSTCFWQGTVH